MHITPLGIILPLVIIAVIVFLWRISRRGFAGFSNIFQGLALRSQVSNPDENMSVEVIGNSDYVPKLLYSSEESGIKYKIFFSKAFSTIAHSNKSLKNLYLIDCETPIFREDILISGHDLTDSPLYGELAGNKVSLEANDFNRTFWVYAKSSDRPFYTLSPENMEKLLEIKEELKNVVIEIHKNKILIYIQSTEDDSERLMHLARVVVQAFE